MLDVPTNWQQMRYCIVAALDKMGESESDRGGIFQSDLQFYVEHIFGDAGRRAYDWDDRSPFGKAFLRAIDSLKADGTVTSDDFGYRLARWN